LDKIQEPFQVERLLDALARRSGLIPEGAHRVRDPEALPAALRELLRQVLVEVWVCFSDGSQAWLLTGMVSVALSRLRNAPVLWVNGYSPDGALIEVGAWAVDPDGNWRRWDNRDTNLNG
jgi:hypothetical protein